jgi:hypothetical protein
MKMKIVLSLVCLAVIGGSVGFYMYQKPSEQVVSAAAAYEVDAVNLFREYHEDEAKANRKYLNRVISVTGKITDVSAVDSLGINVVLETDDPMFGVNCQLPLGDEGHPLRSGEEVTVKGLCTGKLMDVVLIKCLIEK